MDDSEYSAVERTLHNRIFWNSIYLLVSILIQVGAVFLVRELTVTSVICGVYLFCSVLAIEFLEIYQPPSVMRWIPFWRKNLSRGIVLGFLSSVSMRGLFMTGLIALILSLLIFITPLVFGLHNSAPAMIKSASLQVDRAEYTLHLGKETEEMEETGSESKTRAEYFQSK